MTCCALRNRTNRMCMDEERGGKSKGLGGREREREKDFKEL